MRTRAAAFAEVLMGVAATEPRPSRRVPTRNPALWTLAVIGLLVLSFIPGPMPKAIASSATASLWVDSWWNSVLAWALKTGSP